MMTLPGLASRFAYRLHTRYTLSTLYKPVANIVVHSNYLNLKVAGNKFSVHCVGVCGQ